MANALRPGSATERATIQKVTNEKPISPPPSNAPFNGQPSQRRTQRRRASNPVWAVPTRKSTRSLLMRVPSLELPQRHDHPVKAGTRTQQRAYDQAPRRHREVLVGKVAE